MSRVTPPPALPFLLFRLCQSLPAHISPSDLLLTTDLPPPPSYSPRTSPLPPPSYPPKKVPPISWCALKFTRREDNEALAADGWRWRAGGFVAAAAAVSLFITSVYRSKRSLIYWSVASFPAIVLAIDQCTNRRLSRSAVATIIHMVTWFGIIGPCLLVLVFGSDTTGKWNISQERWYTAATLFGAIPPEGVMNISNAGLQGEARELDTWARQEFVRIIVALVP